MINCPDSRTASKVRCAICHSKIEDHHQIYQTTLSLGVVCKICRQRFSKEDIEMIANMFLAYGGYFGQFKRDDFSIENLILKFAHKIDLEKESLTLTNLKMWYEILIHGITPKEFLRALKKYIE
jgi:hypothetical protein